MNLVWMRPALLLLLPLLWLAVYWLRKQNHSDNPWSKVIEPELLAAMMPESDSSQKLRHWRFWLMPAAASLIIAGLAGPAIETRLANVLSTESALVVVLDQSLSMAATDLAPDRQSIAKRKIEDLLELRPRDAIGLVVYSGSAHTAVPITRDMETLRHFLPELSPFIMPGYGSEVVEAVTLAKSQLEENYSGSGAILLITDQIQATDVGQLSDEWPENISLHILALGTEQGAPIKLPDSTFLKDGNGQLIIAQTPIAPLQQLANHTSGRLQIAKPDDSDLKTLFSKIENSEIEKQDRQTQRQDIGYLLLLLAVPLLLPLFRPNAMTAALILLLPTLAPTDAFATDWSWQSLWQNKEQRGVEALNKGQASKALELLDDPDWKAIAADQTGRHALAIELLERQIMNQTTPERLHNLGNALTKDGQLQKALDAYDQALVMQQPNPNPDTQFNRDLVQQLIEQASQQQQGQGSQSGSPDQSDSSQSGQQQPSSQPQPAEQPDSAEGKPQDQQQASNEPDSSLDDETLQRWLDQVQQSPYSLLQQKFELEYHLQRRNQKTEGQLW